MTTQSGGNMSLESIREYVLTTRADDPVDCVDGQIYYINQLTAPDGETWLEVGVSTEPKTLPNGKSTFDCYRCRISDSTAAGRVLDAYTEGDRVRVIGREWHRISVQFGWVVLLEATGIGDLYLESDDADRGDAVETGSGPHDTMRSPIRDGRYE